MRVTLNLLEGNQRCINSFSVTGQTGIKTGDGGFQLEVQGHTDLTRAIIASSQSAVDNNFNRLEKGTLAVKKFDNHYRFKVISKVVSLSIDMFTQGKYGVAKVLWIMD